MSVPADRRYLETHEWHQLTGDVVTIGISQHAADELTDITFVQLPKVGATVAAGKPFGEIESVKATADLMAGVSGQVVAVNDALTTNPGLVNVATKRSGGSSRNTKPRRVTRPRSFSRRTCSRPAR